jgi:hypothetical protein
MKKIFAVLFGTVLFLSLVIPSVWADWVQDGGALNVSTSQNASGPVVVNANGTPYVAWLEMNSGSINQIYVKHWTGSGYVQDGSSLNIDSGLNAHAPLSMTVANGIPCIAWYEGGPNIMQIYVKTLTSGNWAQVGGSLNVNTAQNAVYPSMAIYNGVPYVAWAESNGTTFQVYVKHWSGSGWVQDGGSLNVAATQEAWYTAIAITASGTPYVWPGGKT